ncbi:MAG TPA: IS1595 family transposase [Bacteroidia bacterium]|jgi:transposase-like protein|nr:IS1595 family transposase [Bacteroidia bacterium]
MRFEKLREQVLLSTPSEKEVLINDLRDSFSVFYKHDNVSACPYCTSKHIVKNGIRKEFHRYICRDCKKSFTFRSKSSLRGIHKLNAWNLFLEDFMSLNITPIRILKQRLSVSEQTIFNWRHKLLATLISMEVKYKGEKVEFDELIFLVSRKGRQQMGINRKNKHQYKQWRKSQRGESDHTVKVFAAYGRTSGLLELHKSGMGRTRKTDVEEYFTKDKIQDVTVYCDKHPAYRGFFKDMKIPHETFLSTLQHVSRDNADVHNQTVNSYCKNFKEFVNGHLKGVSTKYMDSYLKWFQYLQATKTELNKQLDKVDQKISFDIKENLRKQIIQDQNGLDIYRRTEFNFTAYLRRNGRTNYGVCKNHYYNTTMADIGTQIFLPPSES